MSVGLGEGVGLSMGDGVGISTGLGVGVAAPEALGETTAVGAPRRRVVASAARITVPNPLFVARVAAGLRSADGLGLASGVGLVSLTATGEEWVPALGWWREPKYTRANVTTRTMRARLAATSVGANMDLIVSHRPFLRMAPVPPCEPALAGPFYPYGDRLRW